MPPPARRFILPGLLALAAVSSLRAESTLAANSPFLPPDGSAVTATENTPLELRGIMMDGSGYRFSIYDPAKHLGQWVRLNEAGHDFTVKAHNVAGDSVTLDYQGRIMTLPLHSAKVVNMPVTQPSGGPKPNPVVVGGGPVPHPPTPEEQERYKRAVEEINRRRAARGKGEMPLPQPQQPPGR